MSHSAAYYCALAAAVVAALPVAAQFEIEETTIAGMQQAIASGETTCRAVVEAYIERAKAYNGVCTALVTADGAAIAPAKGYVRAGKPLEFPTRTVAASSVFPDLASYKGCRSTSAAWNRRSPTRRSCSSKACASACPMRAEINALETLNIRGERSVTCKGTFDAHPSTGPLPAGAPAACEKFRQQPDALERASALDAQYGRNPDLKALPMYCVVTILKDPFDTKDMRSTANNDVNFAMDVPPFDSTIAARLREKGAIIYAKSNAHEFNAGPGDPGGAAEPRTNLVSGGQQLSSWSGQACNPYDTERVVRGSTGGSGAAISANLAMVGICEQSAASCQGPASRNGITLLLPTKGLMPDSGGTGNQWFHDRAGIHARTLRDASYVFEALRTEQGFFDSRDPFTAQPMGLVAPEPYTSFIVGDEAVGAAAKPLKGMRIAILREHMVKETANHVAITDRIDGEIKAVLRDELGAELVETRTPEVPDDPPCPTSSTHSPTPCRRSCRGSFPRSSRAATRRASSTTPSKGTTSRRTTTCSSFRAARCR